ncbi:MAG: hypothetical protein GMKNLPBB_02186 [Myxococcota bacterium]|nr:hypothetical protein [Myxococcota bacterium]
MPGDGAQEDSARSPVIPDATETDAGVPDNAAPDAGPGGPDFSAVDKLMAANAPQWGGAALFIARNGEILFEKEYGGFARDKAVPIASASKWCLGAVIMALADEGKLSLDDTVGKYFPGRPADKSAITLRQLMSHTSGIKPENACISDRASTVRKCAEDILSMPLIAAPGTELHYGGAPMQVAAAIAEKASGTGFSDLFVRKVFVPLQLKASGFGRGANPQAAGGAASSGADYFRFVRMLSAGGELDGVRVLSAAAVRTMHEDQTRGAKIVDTPYARAGGLAANRYGVGNWVEFIQPDGSSVENGSQGLFGWSPWIDRQRKISGVLAVQSRLQDVMPVYVRIREEIRKAVDAAPE